MCIATKIYQPSLLGSVLCFDPGRRRRCEYRSISARGCVSRGIMVLTHHIGRGFNMFQMSSLDAYICTGHVFFCFCEWGVEALFHDPNVKLVVRPLKPTCWPRPVEGVRR